MTPEHLYNSLEIEFSRRFNSMPGLLGDIMGVCREVVFKGIGENLMVKYETPYSLFLGICQALDVRPDVIVIKDRLREKVAIRQFYCYTAKQVYETRFSLTEIGEVIGGKDHTTVIHCVNTCKDRLETNDLLMASISNKWKIFNQQNNAAEK